ncbi:uncharacterized protein LOC134759720 [Pongo abelii]|uniref:uncharacterized protein LOC134759720 n=1 Tax=Pongo abelii TaxID=9601 RepID=UPI003007990B
MWGPRRSSGARSSWGTRTPKSTKRRNEAKTQKPKLAEILLLWIKYKLEASFLKSSFVWWPGCALFPSAASPTTVAVASSAAVGAGAVAGAAGAGAVAGAVGGRCRQVRLATVARSCELVGGAGRGVRRVVWSARGHGRGPRAGGRVGGQRDGEGHSAAPGASAARHRLCSPRARRHVRSLWVFLCHPGWHAEMCIPTNCSLNILCSSNPATSASPVAGTTAACHNTRDYVNLKIEAIRAEYRKMPAFLHEEQQHHLEMLQKEDKDNF